MKKQKILITIFIIFLLLGYFKLISVRDKNLIKNIPTNEEMQEYYLKKYNKYN